MRKNINNFIIIAVATLSISIIFSLATITTIEPTYANHTIYHLNNSLVDVTIFSDGDIPDAVLDELLPVISNYVSQKRETQELDKSLNANDDANEVINQKSVDVQFEGFYNSNYGRLI